MPNRAPTVALFAALSLAACDSRRAATPTESAVDRDAPLASLASAIPSMAHAAKTPTGPRVVIPPTGGFSSQILTRGSFVDDVDITFRFKEGQGATTISRVGTPSDVIMGRIAIQPGGALPWHTHPGPVIVTIASGDLTVVDGEGCAAHTYHAAQSFVDAGHGHVHVAFNPGATETVLYATYLDVPASTPSPLLPASNPGC